MHDHGAEVIRSDGAEPVAIPNRRALLRLATGGFALAASGLLLPGWLAEEAEAREGAYGGELGGRRGKDRRGRHRRRTHGDKKGKNDRNKRKDDRPPGAGAPGGSPIKYVAIRAEGDPGTNVRFYFRTLDNVFGELSLLKPGNFGQFPQDHHSLDYAPKMYSTAVYFTSAHLPYSVFIEARNPILGAPWAQVVWGCDIDAHGNVVGGSTYHRDGTSMIPMDRYNPIEFETGWGNPNGNSSIAVYRYDDSDTHKWFGARVFRLG
jgi:hypothetical protein